MIHRCETCPFWKQRQSLSYGECQKATFPNSSKSNEILLWAEFDKYHEPTVFTDKSFGCVMHPMNKAIA